MDELRENIDKMFEAMHNGQWDEAGTILRNFRCSGQEFHEGIQTRGESELFKLSMLGFYNREIDFKGK